MSESATPTRSGRGSFFLPLAIVGALTLLFMIALHSGDPSRLPSALIGKPVPQFNLPPVDGIAQTGNKAPGFGDRELASGEISIVNVWASWCGPCIQEHPLLTELKRQEPGVKLMGINYKDDPSAALRFLNRLGNPYDALGADRTGRVAIDWGVYGVPETYVVDGKGRIVHKVVGPLSEAIIRKDILPVIAEARKTAAR
jgi:cytochrome c biogenesis protein CcmG/thiol:disulfide interchange protein DsbE